MQWGATQPLEGFSSIHEISFLHFFRFKILFSFNFFIPPPTNSEALLIFHIRNADTPSNLADFSITGCKSWQIMMSQYGTFENFLEAIGTSRYHKYLKTEKIFKEAAGTITRIEGDWSEYVDNVYSLYENVAKKHGAKLYDKSFFHAISIRNEYKLLCAWYQDKMIGMNVLVDEPSILHSMFGGLDYSHSKPLHLYSKLNYEFIKWAFELKKYTIASVGMTADQAKHNIGYLPIDVNFDIYSSRPFIRGFLRFLSKWITAQITAESKLRIRLKRAD